MASPSTEIMHTFYNVVVVSEQRATILQSPSLNRDQHVSHRVFQYHEPGASQRLSMLENRSSDNYKSK
jgi:hypothetical protein